jgi:DNA polymerase-3 subunit alpha
MAEFTHLHNHSEYSLLDGMTTPEEMASIVSTNGQIAAAITDHGTMGGFIRFQKACKQQGVKPIFGVEAYFVDDVSMDDETNKAERFHLILLAKNDKGLENLFRINNVAWTEQFYYKPRIDFNNLEQYGEGLICLSGCMGSALSQAILNGDEKRADQLLGKFQGIFKDDYYLEVQPHNPPELNAKLIDYGDSYNIPIVGTLDCHFPTKQDAGVEEVLLAIGQNSSMNAAQKRHHACGVHDLIEKMDLLYPERRLSFKDLPLYLMDAHEVLEHFNDAGITRLDILENTMEIAEKCNAEIKMNNMFLPSYTKDIKVDMSSNDYLRDVAFFMLQQKGFASDQVYVDRLEEELTVIAGKNFSDYFLVLWDLISWADSDGIARGPARGSAGGSLLSYVLGITNIDPVKHGLLFFRFINPERNDFPDIDLDFEDRRRDEAKEYLRNRWGGENVAGISAYGTFQPKGSIKAVASAFAVPYTEANAISPMFETFEEYKEKDGLAKFRKKNPDVIKVAERLAGRYKNASAHAAGVVVSNVPLETIVPIEVREEAGTKRKINVVAYDKDETGEFGLIKFDALGVRAITVIKDTIAAIKERTGRDVSEDSLNIDNPDSRVFAEFTAGNVIGIFQAEGAGYAALIGEMGVSSFNDLAVSNALVRPGSYVTQGKKYLARRDGTEMTTYDHPILEGILGETYGTFIFEEQVMKIAVELAGFSWAKADRLRKIISKKKDIADFDKYKEEFVAGASQYISASKAKALWADIEKASLYMFNKSHATAYSLVSYQTMWLKVNYPVEFIWATLSNETEGEKITTYLFEAQRIGIEILGPDVNKSSAAFSLDGDALRFGLSNIAGCGAAAVNEIMTKRPFDDYDHFVNTVARSKVKVNNLEALQKVGAFDSIGFDSPYESRRYFGPLLNYPVTMNDKSPFDEIIMPCNLAQDTKEEVNLYIVRGVVKSTKRTPKYFRAEIEDSTGVVSSFANGDAVINKRDYVIAIVGDQTIHHIEDFNEIETGKSDSKFSKFLRGQIDGDPMDEFSFLYDLGVKREIVPNGKSATLAYLINTVRFKTRTDRDMCSSYFYIPDQGWVKTVMFGEGVMANDSELKRSFEWKLIKTVRGKNDLLSLSHVISAEKWCKMNLVDIEEERLKANASS